MIILSIPLALIAFAGAAAASPGADELEAAGRALLRDRNFEAAAATLEAAANTAAAEGDFHSAYWSLWPLANAHDGPWSLEQRLAWFDRTIALLEKCDRADPRWQTVDLPNASQLHMEAETLHAHLGSYVSGFVQHERAEDCMRSYWNGDPTEAQIAAAPQTPLVVQSQLLTERAEYEQRAGRLPAAEQCFQRASDIIRKHLAGAAGQTPMLCRNLNNLSMLLTEMGRRTAADAIEDEAAALRAPGAEGLYPELNKLRRSADVDGPSDALVAKLLEKAAGLRQAHREPDALMAERKAASLMVRAKRVDEGLALMGVIVDAATSRHFRYVAADACLWRAKARGQNNRAGAEDDFIAALEYFRAEGVKPREYAVYYAYADWLLGQERIAEAVAVAGEAVRLNAFMQCPRRRPEVLALFASALLKAGRQAEADAAWSEALALLRAIPDLDEDVRLGVTLKRLEYLAACTRKDEMEATLTRAKAFVAESNLTPYQLRAFRDFAPAAVDPAPAVAQAAVPVELQPLYLSARTVAGQTACGFFWLINPAAVAQTVPLHVAAPGSVRFENTARTTLCVRCEAGTGGVDCIADQPITVPPQTLFPIVAAMAAASETRTLRFSVGSSTARWDVASGAETLGARADLHASLVACNPFYSIPLYHEIGCGTTNTPPVLNFRTRASSPCRIEVYDFASGSLLAVDATGDSAYRDEGDLVLRDADRDGLPDVAANPSPVILRVYPLSGQPAADLLDIALEIRDAAGNWLPIGTDRLLGFGAGPNPVPSTGPSP